MRRLIPILLVILLAGCIKMPEPSLGTPVQPPRDDRNFCSIDADCVMAQCCHPTGAVNRQFGPDCRGIMCTEECAPRTLDCGQGVVACIEGRCMALLTHPMQR